MSRSICIARYTTFISYENHLSGTCPCPTFSHTAFLSKSLKCLLLLLNILPQFNLPLLNNLHPLHPLLLFLPIISKKFSSCQPRWFFTIFNWKNTKTALLDKPFVGRVPPDTNSPNSLFIDRKFNRIGDQSILDHFRDDLLGIDFFPQQQFLQLTFKDEQSFKHHLSSSPITLNDKLIHLTPPKNFPRSTLVIHLHGLPIMDKATIKQSICAALSPFCNIKEIAPIVIANTNILTTKWDAVVHPLANTKIPVHLNILDSSIALTGQIPTKYASIATVLNTNKTCLSGTPQNKNFSYLYSICN